MVYSWDPIYEVKIFLSLSEVPPKFLLSQRLKNFKVYCKIFLS